MGDESLLSVLPGDMENRAYRIEIRPYRAGHVRVQLLTSYGVLASEAVTDDMCMAMDVMNRCASAADPEGAMLSLDGRLEGRCLYLGRLR